MGHDLIYRVGNHEHPKVCVFRNWILQEVREFMKDLGG